MPCIHRQPIAAVPNAVSNPYPADGAIDIPSTFRLTWDHAKGAGGAPTGYRVTLWEAPLNPNGFTFKFEMYGIRYYLSNAPATWEVARQNSWSWGGYLASSFSAQMNTLFQTHAPEGQNVFIGLSDYIEEGVYKWQDGRTFGYSNWDTDTGEPNNSGGGDGEDAVEMRKSNGKWNDISVTASRYYFMQIPGKVINNEITATAYYDFNHVVSFNRVFYWNVTPFNADGDGPTSSYSFRIRNSGNIPAATTAVGPTGGSNVLNPTLSWNSVADAEYYKLYLWKARGNPDAGGNSLIGVYNGHAYYKSNDLVTWETARANCESWGAHLMTINSQDENDIAPGDFSYWIGMHDTATEGDIHWVTGEQVKYTNWATNEPNGDTEDYMHVRTDKKWNDNSEGANLRYLIEYPGTILDGKVVTGTSYSLGDANLEPNSSYCWIAIPYSTSGRPWVTGWWQFSTGNGGAAPGTISGIVPNDGAIDVPIDSYMLWDVPSGSPTEYYAYFGTNNTIDNAANYTDLGFWNGHHYYRYNLETLPWCSAEAQAKLDGGYLATIGSDNENTKLAELGFGNEYTRWFGGNDRLISNVWKYSNGDPWTYTNWLIGEPNNGGGAQYFTAINWGEPGKWDDQSNTHSRYFLLETAPNITDGVRVTMPTYTPPLMRFNTTYYWSAVGSNAYGMANDTQRWSFTTTDGKVKNPSPAHLEPAFDGDTFGWEDISGSVYKIYIGTANGTWDIADGIDCATSDFTPLNPLELGTQYFWMVKTISPLENVDSAVWSFTMRNKPPIEINGLEPDPSGVTVTKDPIPVVPPVFPGTPTLKANSYTITATGEFQVIAYRPDDYLGQWFVVLIVGSDQYGPFDASAFSEWDFGMVDFGDAKGEGKFFEDEGDGFTLPVELSYFAATLTAQNYVKLAWASHSETSLLGYRVYRNESNQQYNAINITPVMIPATNTSTTHSYSIVDIEVELGRTYYYWLESIDVGQSTFHGPTMVFVEGQAPPVLPEYTSMRSAYPNPFISDSSTRIELSVKAGEAGTMTIYNVAGQVVKRFEVSQGNITLQWNGRDDKGQLCSSGIYFYKLSTPTFNQTRKLVVIR